MEGDFIDSYGLFVKILSIGRRVKWARTQTSFNLLFNDLPALIALPRRVQSDYQLTDLMTRNNDNEK